MSKLLKSKFLLGVLVVAIMFVASAVVKTSSAAADCSITSTLRVGSTGAQVVCLQTALGGLTADGSFGPKTKAAVVAWQAKEGLVADGVFGPKSNAVWAANQGNSANFPVGCSSAVGYSPSTGLACYAITSYPAGCNSNSGYSATTGLSCAGVSSNLPAGCTSTAGYSPTTGMVCSATSNLPAGCSSTAGYSPTTGGSCSGAPIVSSTGEGSLAVTFDAIPANNLAVNRGATASVMAVKLKATGSDMRVSRIWLDINTRIWLSATTVDLLDGSTVIATLPLSASTVTEVTAGSAYQLQFNNLSVVVPNGTTKVLTFRVTRPTLTTQDTSVTVAATSTVRAVDMAGISNTYVLPSARIWNMGAVAATTGTMTTALGSSSPAIQSASSLSATAGVLTPVKLADFNFVGKDSIINITQVVATISSTKPGTVDVTNNSATVTGTGTSFLSTFVVGDTIKVTELTDAQALRTISAIASDTSLTTSAVFTASGDGSSTYTSATAVGNKVASAELRDGTNVLSSVALVAGVATFPALNIDVAKDSTKVLSVWAQVNPIGLAVNTTAKGSDLTATLNSSLTVASDSGYATVTISSADVAGNAQYFFQYAPTITLVSATGVNAGVDNKDGSFSLTLSVTAPSGSDIYVDRSVGMATVIAYNAAASTGLSKSNVSTDYGGTLVTSATVSGASSLGNGTEAAYDKVSAGTSRTFVITGYIPAGGTLGFNGMHIDGIRWSAVDNSSGVVTVQTWGLANFFTPTVYIKAS